MKNLFATILFAACAAMISEPLNAADKEKSKVEAQASDRKVKNIDVEQFDKLTKTQTNVVLDVRTKKEFQEGHLPGAVHMDFNGDNFDQEIAKLDKNKTYLVHCGAGGRSSRACKKMEQGGFKSLYNMEGGLTAWQKAGKPVQKD
jgi:rhodanese-related sulfurtransferase